MRWFNDWSVKKKLAMGFGVCILLILALGACAALFAGGGQAVVLICVVTAVAAVMGGVVGIFVTEGVSRPLGDLTRAVKRIAHGDFGVALDLEREDEIGDLAVGMDDIVKAFTRLDQEVSEMGVKFIKDGDIDARLNPRNFKGDYQKICSSINKTFNNLLDDILDILTITDQYAEGDFSVSLRTLVGKKQLANRSLDKLRENCIRIHSAIDELTKAAYAGNLSARIDEREHTGEWRAIIKGLNSMLYAFIVPINESIAVLGNLSQGSLDKKIEGNYQGDYAKMKESLNATILMLSRYVTEISEVLSSIAKKDLTKEVSGDYIGGFAPIKESLGLISNSFNGIISEINVSAEQVASGARQISESSMMLAQGATEQAASVDELTTTLETINSQTTKNADNAETASKLASSAKDNADVGNDRMKEMLTSMNDINEASQNIYKIIKVIEEIALQTNLLALNASVEAAHAGVHGKGFTVVAEQVGNLAGRSQEAARQTTALIEGTVAKVGHGLKIANQTAEMLTTIVGQITEISDLISGVADASDKQAEDISKVNSGISRISEVTQTNSATSEEEASSSQELSSQAEVFRNMVEQFKLKKEAKKPIIQSNKAAKPIAFSVPETKTAETDAKDEKEAAEAKPAAVKPAVVKPAVAKPSAEAVKPEAKLAAAPKAAPPKAESAKPEAAKPAPTLTPRENKEEFSTKPPKKGANNATFYSSYDSNDFGKYQ